jgi:5'-methylthioadenosine phosphorylase
MDAVRIAVIGGTGLYQIEGMTDLKEIKVGTPFGNPSDSIVIGTVEGQRVAFLPRHGIGHRISPTELPSRANIYALKSLGVEWIIAINSAGSFKKELAPGHLLIPDQVIDRTTKRANTFFDNGIVAHISFANPFCPVLGNILYQAARDSGAVVHKGGVFVTMEGPAFSSKAESLLYCSWGADIIGMTVLPEAKLAREAEICYATLACVTDYDCWREDEEKVTVDKIIAVLRSNVEMAKKIIRNAVTHIPQDRNCECATALKNAIVTAPERIPAQRKKDLKLIIGKYIN